MALQRKSPLPVGRYWVDCDVKLQPTLDTYFRDNAANVQVETTQDIPATSDHPAREFYIFNVKAPVPWNAVTFGFPTIATAAVQSAQDTAQEPPPPPDPMVQLEGYLDSAGSFFKLAIGGVLLAGVGALYSRLKTKG